MLGAKHTLNITLSASIDSGEGYLNERSTSLMQDFVTETSPLWALDVLGDWKGEISYRYNEANAAYLGEYAYKHILEKGKSPRDIALTLAQHGVDVADDSMTCMFTLYAADHVKGIPDYWDISDEARTPDFKKCLAARAKAEADEIVELILAGKTDTVEDSTDYAEMVHRAVAYGLVERLTGVPVKFAAE